MRHRHPDVLLPHEPVSPRNRRRYRVHHRISGKQPSGSPSLTYPDRELTGPHRTHGTRLPPAVPRPCPAPSRSPRQFPSIPTRTATTLIAYASSVFSTVQSSISTSTYPAIPYLSRNADSTSLVSTESAALSPSARRHRNIHRRTDIDLNLHVVHAQAPRKIMLDHEVVELRAQTVVIGPLVRRCHQRVNPSRVLRRQLRRTVLGGALRLPRRPRVAACGHRLHDQRGHPRPPHRLNAGSFQRDLVRGHTPLPHRRVSRHRHHNNSSPVLRRRRLLRRIHYNPPPQPLRTGIDPHQLTISRREHHTVNRAFHAISDNNINSVDRHQKKHSNPRNQRFGKGSRAEGGQPPPRINWERQKHNRHPTHRRNTRKTPAVANK